VSTTADPFHTLNLYNTEQIGNRETNALAPFWRLSEFNGPFLVPESAQAQAQYLVDYTRGYDSKQRNMAPLARKSGVRNYSSNIEPPGGTDVFLKKHAPPPVYNIFLELTGKEEEEAHSNNNNKN
jgi:hypothetical protein